MAEQSIMDWWKTDIQPRFPSLQLMQNDVAALRPRQVGAKSGQSDIDFLVRNKSKNKPLFAIENKTGRSSIKGMSQFQLDISDCDCITFDLTRLKIPGYIIHAQVLEIWEPPTMGYQAIGLWWTDIYRMAEGFSSTRQRRDEARGAAYFKRSAFAEISSFADSLMEGGKFLLVERFKNEGMPALYVSKSDA